MGLFKKIREIDKAVDNFVEGMVSNAVNTVVNFASQKSYTINITFCDEVIGTLEFVSSDPDFAFQKVNNYLASGIPLDRSINDIIAWYSALDNLNIGASRQLFKLDEMKLRKVFSDAQVRNPDVEQVNSDCGEDEENTSLNVQVRNIGRTDYWDDINIGDTVEAAIAKAKNGAKEVEPGLFQLNGANFRFDTRNFMVITGKVEGLTAVKYFPLTRSAQSIKDEMNLMLPFVRKGMFNNLAMVKVEEYDPETDLRGNDHFTEAIREGVLSYGYWPEDGSISPSFQLIYDDDTPDKLLAMATVVSQNAADVMV